MTDQQLALVTPPPPYRHESETSREAAGAIAPNAETLRHRVFQYLKHFGPAHDAMVAEALGIPENTVRPRRGELAKLGLVVPHGEALTRSGRRARTWSAS